MILYMAQWRYNPGVAKIFMEYPLDRSQIVKSLMQDFGGVLESFYMSLGEWDGVLICRFPDSVSFNAFLLAMRATGGLEQSVVTVLLTPEEAKTSMEQARDTDTAYSVYKGAVNLAPKA
jgi:uncharacterized protein with GYD domain